MTEAELSKVEQPMASPATWTGIVTVRTSPARRSPMVTSTGSAPASVSTTVPPSDTVTSPAGSTVEGRSSVTTTLRTFVSPELVTVST